MKGRGPQRYHVFRNLLLTATRPSHAIKRCQPGVSDMDSLVPQVLRVMLLMMSPPAPQTRWSRRHCRKDTDEARGRKPSPMHRTQWPLMSRNDRCDGVVLQRGWGCAKGDGYTVLYVLDATGDAKQVPGVVQYIRQGQPGQGNHAGYIIRRSRRGNKRPLSGFPLQYCGF